MRRFGLRVQRWVSEATSPHGVRLVPAVALLLLTGCAAELLRNQPDLAQLYDRSAQTHGPERNPVIVIPGLMGSRLIDETSGRVVWGVFGGDYARPKRPEDARLMALPMQEGVALRDLRDSVRADGVLDLIKVKVLGIPINLRAYYQILDALGVGGYREASASLAQGVEWGDDHYTCFQFDYDWRRDNVENARRLETFIEARKAYVRAESKRRFGVDRPDLKFDLVTHSMGGLLVRYYLRYGGAELPEDGGLPPVTWAGAANIERAVLVGPPNAGTLESVTQLVEGKNFGPFATYPPALLGTFPSGYQMLPRGRHGMVVASGRTGVNDLFDPEFWQRMGWGLASSDAEELISWLLPDEPDAAVRRRIALDHQSKVLARAEHFTRALDQPAEKPSDLEIFLMAGDATPTPRRMAVGPGAELSVIATASGDGKVLRDSALMDERLDGTWSSYVRSPIDWANVMFLPQAHLDLTKDPVFTDNLLFWLLESPRKRP